MLQNKIIQGDVLKKIKILDDDSFDLVIADPPYNQKIDSWDTFNEKEYWSFMDLWIKFVSTKIKNGGSIFIFNNPYNSALTIPILEKWGFSFQNWITWYKKDGFGVPKKKFRTMQEVILFFTKGEKPKIFNIDAVREPYKSTQRIKAAEEKGIIKNGKRWFPNPKGALRSDIWEFVSQRHKDKINGKVQKHWHKTQKPHDLIKIIIKISTNSSSKILDLFSGSGSTTIVAKKMSINSLGIELNCDYVKKIKEILKNV